MTKLIKLYEQINKTGRGLHNIIMPKKNKGRFDGLTEEEVKKKDSLPDYLEPDLDIVFVGINPSLMSAFKGRYYAGPGNHFYKLLHASELVAQFVSFEEDYELLQYKIGLTNIVDRPTRSSADLTAKEIKKGCEKVVEKLKFFKPKIAVFNGKCIYQIYAQQFGKTKFDFGLQLEKIGETAVWVVPSSSARCSNFPRMTDKLHFYQAIKKHLQVLRGNDKDVDVTQFYSIDNGVKTKSSSKIAGSKKKIQKNSVTDEHCQYVIAEILDGSQKKKVKEENGEEKEDSEEDEQEVEEGQKGEGQEGDNKDEKLDRQCSSSTSNNENKLPLNTKSIISQGVVCDNAYSINGNVEDKNLKRNWKSAQTVSGSHENNEVSFMTLIKQRIREKKEAEENEVVKTKVNKDNKKLNFSNLRKKRN